MADGSPPGQPNGVDDEVAPQAPPLPCPRSALPSLPRVLAAATGRVDLVGTRVRPSSPPHPLPFPTWSAPAPRPRAASAPPESPGRVIPREHAGRGNRGSHWGLGNTRPHPLPPASSAAAGGIVGVLLRRSSGPLSWAFSARPHPLPFACGPPIQGGGGQRCGQHRCCCPERRSRAAGWWVCPRAGGGTTWAACSSLIEDEARWGMPSWMIRLRSPLGIHLSFIPHRGPPIPSPAHSPRTSSRCFLFLLFLVSMFL